MENRECRSCKKMVDFSKDKYVLLGTYREEPPLTAEVYYHFECWEKWLKTLVKNEASKNVKTIQSKAQSLFSNVFNNPLLQGFTNSPQFANLQGMINKEVKIEEVENLDDLFKEKKKEKKKKKDDGKKRTRKNKV